MDRGVDASGELRDYGPGGELRIELTPTRCIGKRLVLGGRGSHIEPTLHSHVEDTLFSYVR